MTTIDYGWLVRSMSKSEFTKLTKRRGLFWTSLLLSFGSVVVYYAVLEIMHLISPATHGVAGGALNLSRAINIETLIGGTAAILVGANAGAGDSNGVFRDLVATGRSRVGLFFARISGALGMFWPMFLAAFVTMALVSTSLAGTGVNAAPSLGTLAHYGAIALLSTTFELLLALGLASFTVSKSVTIAVLMAWEFIVQQLLLLITWFGVTREILPLSAIGRLSPKSHGPLRFVPGESAFVAIVVLVVWTVVAVGIGAIKTRRMDA
ncbi:hypothetical protein [Ferrimicrobium acidiphilum]|uniref:hypothetical protein n=1 Tax=Ferrimicrobium acidiphilum TaxID=121039 RepID=UPI00181F7468|nr:hypothetical protein [Ferrimicrobium acidiphilum]NNN10515.1 hypothetical protein [Acidimicrobiaceae bacterium]